MSKRFFECLFPDIKNKVKLQLQLEILSVLQFLLLHREKAKPTKQKADIPRAQILIEQFHSPLTNSNSLDPLPLPLSAATVRPLCSLNKNHSADKGFLSLSKITVINLLRQSCTVSNILRYARATSKSNVAD